MRLGAIALLALLVRAVVPAGYMVAAADTPDGRYLMVQLCDGHATTAQAIDLDTGKQIDIDKLPKSPSKGSGSDQPCAFASTAAFAPPVASVEPVEMVTPSRVFVDALPTVSPGRGIAAPPPPATGPPSLI